ncbi:MAG: hypothetical protein IPP14_06175 [Planctomycetes bacterium]|nr:hypothetical protein [Planctomycetota bacterium]
MRTFTIVNLAALLLLALGGCDSAPNAGHDGQAPAGPAAPTITTTVLPHATRGTPYLAQLGASSPAGTGNVAWALNANSAALPTGLALSSYGAISGTPTQSGLSAVKFDVTNDAGGVASVLLDVVVYESVGYTHTPDMYDTPSNDTLATATPLGAVTPTAPFLQTTPLSVTSNPADPSLDARDFFAFSTTLRGEIRIAVYFSAFIGKLHASLYGEHGGELELVQQAITGQNGDDQLLVLPDAGAGNWVLGVEAQYKNGTWNANGYTFRLQCDDMTIPDGLLEYDRQSGPMQVALSLLVAGTPTSGATWSLATGSPPTGVSLTGSGLLVGNPGQNGLFELDVVADLAGRQARRMVQLRVLNSGTGDYWQRRGEHRLYDAARPDGDGAHHEHYTEAMVVAPHPAYGSEGAIYLLGGRTTATVGTVFVFHTTHQADPDRAYKLEDIGHPLTSERQYLGAAYLQHTYGGYIYAVGGELYSNTAPSSGAYTRVVERMQVADGAGNALAVPGAWQALAELPANDAGRTIEGYAEFALAVQDGAADGDDRLYLLGGRRRIETTAGSGSYTKDFLARVLMFEAPTSAGATGNWLTKPEAAAYTPRRFPAVAMIAGRIYLAGGRAAAGATDIIEMYQPDPLGLNAAISMAGASGFPVLAQPAWCAAAATFQGALYILNGWDSSASPQATQRLQRFVPNGTGTGGSLVTLAQPDAASGFHSAVFHAGRLWFITGRDPFVPTPHYSLAYTP